MPPARHWSASRLLFGWLGVVVSLGPSWWLLQGGVYASILEDGVVRRASGHWSAEVALGVWLIWALASLGTMAWYSVTWFLGRKTRASSRAAEAAVHRQVLM